jgi:FAD:protein FMN transferase
MTRTTRRRFLTISAALALTGLPARAAPLRHTGTAMGAAAAIILDHPQADRIAARTFAEVARLEDIFSLHRPGSALCRLNAAGQLDAPPFELLDCLSLASAVHAVTGGAFDPTVQPLWSAAAAAITRGEGPDPAPLLPLVGWDGVTADSDRITLARPGMALTLNGIAQGYVADRVTALLAAEGLTDILIDMGEIAALGGDPRGGDWQARIATGPAITLRDRALATSAPRGTVLDPAGRHGHILDPRTGQPAAAGWALVSVTASRAALADALSTAFCLMDRPAIDAALARLPDASLVHLA